MRTLIDVEAALDEIHQRAPQLLKQSLLIGGWCALLYYDLLKRACDPRFPTPTPQTEDQLTSKDIDFTHVWSEDYFSALPEFIFEPEKGSPYLSIHGIRLGFAQIPAGIDPDEAYGQARRFKTRSETQFAVLDPVRLYRGKMVLIQKVRAKASDEFHLRIGATYARYELAQAKRKLEAEASPRNRERLDHLVSEMQNLAPELLL